MNFLAFVSFFPQLVAGPIERAAHLLPQFERSLSITRPMLEEGLWLMLWGLFKKVVLADNFAPLTDLVYRDEVCTAPAVLLGTFAFALQIYCDFSGYSDIARGSARVLGYDIMVNFNLPYAATNVREFWQRWHISLSTWLRDYLYIPLGGNRCSRLRQHVNLMTTMLLGGLWPGAAWRFVVWGGLHGVALAVEREERLLLRFEVYGPGGTTPAASAKLLNRDGRPMMDLPLESPTAEAPYFQGDVPISSLAPGEYLLVVAGSGPGGSSRQLVAIKITS